MDKKRCSGIFSNLINCNRYVDESNEYCEPHSYFSDLTTDEIDKIKNGKAKCCTRCQKWHFGQVERCQQCKNYNNQLKRDKNAYKKCKWNDRHMDQCRKMAFLDTEYCDVHQYVKDYTDEMKQLSKLCKGCNKIKYLENGCDSCRERAKLNRDKGKDKIICKGMIDGNACRFEALDNGYCGKHQVNAWKEEIEKNNKVCVNYVRGCRNVMEIGSEFSRCDSCREKEREKDKINRIKSKVENKNVIIIDDEEEIKNNSDILNKKIQELLDSNKKTQITNKQFKDDSDEYLSDDAISDDETNDISIGKKLKENVSNNKIQAKKCIKCNKFYTLDKFITLNGQQSDKCNVVCLPKEREKDRLRDRSGRDYSEYCNRQEVKERKAEWKENNYDKVAGYWIDARARRIENEGVDNYLKKNADYAKKQRLSNPEKQKQINKEKCLNINYKYNDYKREAERKGRKYELTYEQSKEYFLGNCYYCGYIACYGIQLNGIDRKDNNRDYTVDNCVTACEMCNRMKGDELDDKQFVNVCEHILTNLGIIEGELHPECFSDYAGTSFWHYKNRALKKNLEFELTECEFYRIVDNLCYLCGKKNSEFHNNGVDRIYNNIGYYIFNSKSCCGTCNYLKNTYSLPDILNKMIKIYVGHKKICPNITIDYSIEYIKLINPYKLEYESSIEYNKRIKERTRKQQYRDKLRREMGIDAYKEKMRIEKLKQLGKITDDGIIPPKQIKKSKEQIREEARLRKQKQREQLKQKYGDEGYRKMRAEEIAKLRAAKKTN
ncbi:hypothetical protein QKU48_gp0453 [Fadolivirus algeromassiliense]|jgi:hypothetical protein|uniref:Uncharacterized protein n=1 Tax=Fadolivirus FV1/VV64 TaxID=3070911 RepID=A0A7D3UU58_9VIRU|nr:hypothetical protein QKU48_gp0453 [Fadolivirus algeromassiliense]QKF93911.1 hypothetical protein Fadolivirus_1_453 [Fadolivirus FV1/VV64]